MRNFVITVIVALAVFGANEQAAAQTVGVKLGPTFSKLSESDGDPETLTSLGGGAFGRFGSGSVKLQLEVLAITKGFKHEESFGIVDELGGVHTIDVESSLNLTYVEVPVTVMYQLGAPYVFGGGAVAFQVDCKRIAKFENDTESRQGCDADPLLPPQAERKKVDLGLVGGVGVEFPVGPGNVLIEARYTHGLLDLRDDPEGSAFSIEEKNRSFYVFAGFGIPIGGR